MLRGTVIVSSAAILCKEEMLCLGTEFMLGDLDTEDVCEDAYDGSGKFGAVADQEETDVSIE